MGRDGPCTSISAVPAWMPDIPIGIVETKPKYDGENNLGTPRALSSLTTRIEGTSSGKKDTRKRVDLPSRAKQRSKAPPF